MNPKREHNAYLISYADIPASGFTGPHFPGGIEDLNSAYTELVRVLNERNALSSSLIDELKVTAIPLLGYVGYVPLVTRDKYKWIGAVAFGKDIYGVEMLVCFPGYRIPFFRSSIELERSIALYSTRNISATILTRLCSNYALNIRQNPAWFPL